MSGRGGGRAGGGGTGGGGRGQPLTPAGPTGGDVPSGASFPALGSSSAASGWARSVSDVSATGFYQPIRVTDSAASYLNIRDLQMGLSDQDRIKKMVDGGRVDTWGCVNFSRNFPAEQFCHDLISVCTAKGMVFNPEPFIHPENESAGPVVKALLKIGEMCQKNSIQLQLLIIILPDISGEYGTIKRICETELGIVSQCCDPKKASRSNNQQYLENVALKINVKVGGRNSVLTSGPSISQQEERTLNTD